MLPVVAHAQWQAVENVQTYPITGTSGAELYASIGARGPMIGGTTRTIAHTNFKLTWTRKYEQRGSACVLASARPKLIITYTLPKPSGQLPAAVARQWDTFIAGIRAHEAVHGADIKDLVKAIEAFTVGLSVPDDPGCQKIRAVMTKRLSELSLEQRQKSRDFDQVEHSEGGNIHRLVLELVNGG
ncbi:DUF922 domain-containing protein (plasmid) [Phyllobacterium sp. 628]|uniref:DUF922 domain-containing Zn-dependent protease n=1 Tax=Phyllobacterium sp. 628 TaxID=2718938 RepID=UPI0016628452|nr:DUF922 domain-containing protein [Phyllobacterium sp. 628]QND55220.1 DUF922 domain-containing protein [Phyllobacterium sp. 628]